MSLLRWLGFLVGIAIVVATSRSVIGTIIIPRSSSSKIVYRAWLLVNSLYMFVARRFRAYEQQDRILSSLGAIALLFTLGVWIIFFLLGYALLFLPFIDGGVDAALWLSGSSIFTLGVASSSHPGPIVLEFLAAATGLIVIALQIGYLPTIYGAYNRREMLVTALSSRAGDPAWGPEILARHQLDGTLLSLRALYSSWELLAADIQETHSSYPWLIVFRSPEALHSWIISLLAVIDSAALFLTLAPSIAPMEARQCLRMGFLCLRKIGHITGAIINDDPRPDDPIALTFAQFAQGVEHLRLTGFPLERTAEEAWPHFQGWRVNYEVAAYALASFVIAVPAPWSGMRLATTTTVKDVLNRRPRHRSPDDPEGVKVLRLTLQEESKAHQVNPPAEQSKSSPSS